MKNKRQISVLLSLSLVLGFGSLPSVAADTNPAQEFYVGAITGPEIMSSFKSFNEHFDRSVITDTQVAQLQSIAEPITVKVFFGQWCHDSVREVPRLINLFERSKNENVAATFYALDTSKSDPEGMALKYGIKRTPTVIVYKGDTELGRFLEFPKTNWANDIAQLANAN